jgi:signal peptidase I
MLGPRSDPVWFEASYDDGRGIWRFTGASLRDAGAELVLAVDRLRPTRPELGQVALGVEDNALVVGLPDLWSDDTWSWNETLQETLLESFRIPTSGMMPTLWTGDRVFAAKGPLRGTIDIGDVVVHRDRVEKTFVHRVVAREGQTVKQTATGLAVDGVPLETVLQSDQFSFVDIDERSGDREAVAGKLFLERLGGRTHPVLRLREGFENEWVIPAGHIFLVGDNRDNSRDCRHLGPVPVDQVFGRVVARWYATTDEGLPDWDRIAVPVH